MKVKNFRFFQIDDDNHRSATQPIITPNKSSTVKGTTTQETIMSTTISSLVTTAGYDGSIDCPCIDVSSLFISAANCIVGNGNSINNLELLPTDGPGLGVSVYGLSTGTYASTCFPLMYGSGSCNQHDLSVHPSCQVVDDDDNNLPIPLPEFCYESFCYVDYNKCKDSKEIFRRTDQFGFLETDIYYSYSTCHSTADYYTEHMSTQAVKDKFITVTVPGFWHPAHYKIGASGSHNDISEQDYLNDTIPWEGWLMNYLGAVLEVSDISGWNYTHRSGGSSVVVTSSTWTAAVYDIQAGLSCLSSSLFWITTERLQMTSFTTPLTIDKVMLYIKNPSGEKNKETGSLYANILKFAMPFEPALWLILLTTMVLVSMMGVWFANKDGTRNKWWYKLRDEAFIEGTLYYRTTTLLNIFLDSFLASANDTFGQSVEFDMASTLSKKLLNFGFSFLILVVAAAYTANLAAFLTIQGDTNVDYIRSVEEAILTKTPLCGHNALRSELITTWPGANWVFNEASKGSAYDGMLENFDAGNCGGLIGSKGDVLHDTSLMNKFCVRNLVDTNRIILEKPIAFPACNDIVAGISYWIYEAEKRGIAFKSYQDASQPPSVCQMSIYDNGVDGVQDDLRPLTPANFALPLLTVVLCSLIATILQLRHKIIVHYRRSHYKRDATPKTNTLRNNEDTTSLPTSFDNKFPNNNQQDQHDDDQLFVVRPVLSPILVEDVVTPNNSDTILKTLRDIQNYQKNLVELLVTQQQQQRQQQKE